MSAIRGIFTLVCLFATAVCIPPVAAQSEADQKPESSEQEIDANEATQLQKFEFGIGIGVELYREPFINEAKVFGDERVVRIVDSQEIGASIWLETHYTWDGFAARRLKRSHSAPGSYLGVRLVGQDAQVFDVFSVGPMWSFKRKRLDDRTDRRAINIGLGPVWHRTRRLLDGIEAGQPLPRDFGNVEYAKGDEVSWMLMVSTGFLP